MRCSLAATLVAAILVPVAGCGGSSSPEGPGYGSPDGRAVAQLVESVNDVKSTAAEFQKLFAAGAAPKDATTLKKYPMWFFEVSGNPTVTDTTATAKVKVRPEGKDGGDEKELEWSFVKEGDAWKIKTAPLP